MAERYLEYLLGERRYEEAAALTPRLLKVGFALSHVFACSFPLSFCHFFSPVFSHCRRSSLPAASHTCVTSVCL